MLQRDTHMMGKHGAMNNAGALPWMQLPSCGGSRSAQAQAAQNREGLHPSATLLVQLPVTNICTT